MTIKKITLFLLILLLIGASIAVFTFYDSLKILNGYAAKNACSCLFVANRDLASIKNQELSEFPISLANINLNEQEKSVSSNIFGFLAPQKASFRKGLGCSLIHGKNNFTSKTLSFEELRRSANDLSNWPKIIPRSELKLKNQKSLNDAFELAFQNKNKTRALLVIKNDTLIHEQYASGFDEDTPQLGWSMTKSIANALIGILVNDNKLNLTDQINLPYRESGDTSTITLKHLLQMTSGIDWTEDYSTNSSANKLLWLEEDVMKFATNRGQEATPGVHWEYSSGTTNILSGHIRKTLNDDNVYFQFPYKRLFNKLGMSTATLETDEMGNYVLSSFGYASARDWAKFGGLYLKDGFWNGEQILAKEWIDFSKTPVQSSENLKYGAQFWLNTNGNTFPSAPEDTYFASGYQGQRIIIIPSENMIIVRLGLIKEIEWNEIISKLISAF